MGGDAEKVKPVLFGYLQVRLGTAPEVVAEKRRRMAVFAEVEGFALAEVFADVDHDRPLSAFAALIGAAREHEAAAVVIAEPEDLGRLDHVRLVMRRRLEDEADVRLLVAGAGSGGSLRLGPARVTS